MDRGGYFARRAKVRKMTISIQHYEPNSRDILDSHFTALRSEIEAKFETVTHLC
jgi:hypothetical protein